MIRINLLPTKEKEQAASQRQELSLFVLVAILVLLAFTAVRIRQSQRLSSLEQEISGLEQAVAALRAKVKDVSDLDAKRKELDAKLKVIAELGQKRVGPAGVLIDLGRAIPDRAWLTEFIELKGAATLTGGAVDNQTIAQFLRELSNSPYFTTVDLVETTAQDRGEVRLRKVILKAHINYAASPKKDSTSPAVEEGPAG